MTAANDSSSSKQKSPWPPAQRGRLRHLRRWAGRAIGDFDLIQAQDRILVAISGGKDSWALLYALLELRRRSPVPYELVPVTIHPGFADFDPQPIRAQLQQWGLHWHVEETDIADIIQAKRRPGSSWCSLCARLRRGALYGVADRLACNKLALGHHLDDALETFLLNQFYIGTLSGLSPKLAAENGRHTVIRPLLYVEEKDVAACARQLDVPLCPCGCPPQAQENSQRQAMKELIVQLRRQCNPHVKSSLLKAMGNLEPQQLLDQRYWNTPPNNHL